jgi:cell division protein FtsQ
MAFGGWWAVHSSIFDAHHIVVTGETRLSRSEVIRASGVGRSTNVFFADPSAVEAALEANPWVADATVTRALPSTIGIQVTERRPASTVAVGSTWFLVAADGTVLGPAAHRPHLPMLPTAATVTIGARSPALAGPAAVAGGMSPELRAHVVNVAPGPDGSVQLGMDDGVRVLFGSATDVLAKDQAIAGIVDWARERHTALATIDVRSPDAPDAIRLDAVQPGISAPGWAGAGR